ncbi:cation diffusion facilitator family transporter [Paralcaligenes ureilyticus]|uniref:Cation diffusion facilitator family transporter n=1 Tax=Paralcaligenes ureilyticus TaxID=627131 RepID=A0A4R3MD26_9BURK|nr:cation diffusion facilitator family transporter [Paralcaligenes ureilyticus]TCT11032.1 cation diffusion facilitator family transporter [Paralcaligenes ureilyticus]
MDARFETKRQTAGHRSTLVSVAVNIVLTLIQIIVGVLAHSQALIADAIHSLSDLISDAVVLVANKQGQKAPDADHPYGHLRFETAASLILGALLLTVGLGLLWAAFVKLQNPAAIPKVHAIALIVAIVALMSKELLFRYMLQVAQGVRSSMLIANAWHARSDAASSLVVAIGIIANLAGFPMADPLAALIVGIMVARIGWKFFFSAFNDLMDRAVDVETENRIRGHLASTPGVQGIHGLKTRKMGDMIWVEVDLEMDATLTIAQGHAIAEDARNRVMQHEAVLDVTTHFDPVQVNRAGAPP